MIQWVKPGVFIKFIYGIYFTLITASAPINVVRHHRSILEFMPCEDPSYFGSMNLLDPECSVVAIRQSFWFYGDKYPNTSNAPDERPEAARK